MALKASSVLSETDARESGNIVLHCFSFANFELFYQDSCFNAEPGELINQFTTSELHTYGAGNMMQMSTCISLRIVHYGKSIWRL